MTDCDLGPQTVIHAIRVVYQNVSKGKYSRHSVNGPSVNRNMQLTDFYKSGNQMARLRDYIYYVPTIRLPGEKSGN